MPNIIDANGVQIKELQDIVKELSDSMELIYGNDINLESETPDAQMIMIFTQAVRDIEELIFNINAMFDPDQAQGRILDQRVAYNGIQRQGSSYSITNVEITVDRAVQLFGLDYSGQDQKYIVEDDSGTKWILRNTVSLIAGTHSLSFRSEEAGAVLSVVGTIRTPVTIINGVTDVNNSLSQTTIGDNEESDAALKERRRVSVSLSSQGYKESLLAALKNIPNMVDAYVYENRTSQTDSRGMPPHSIWVITDGTANDEDIANAIYRKRNAGADLKQGTKEFVVTEIDGGKFLATWDEVEIALVYIKMDLLSIDSTVPLAIDVIKSQLPNVFRPSIGGSVNITDLASAVKSIDSNAIVINAGFSKTISGAFEPVLFPEMNERFGFSSNEIIITPIEILPRINAASVGVNIQLSASGGLAPFTWSVVSGPATVSPTGVFNGSSIGTVVVRVQDSLGNITNKTIQVVS